MTLRDDIATIIRSHDADWELYELSDYMGDVDQILNRITEALTGISALEAAREAAYQHAGHRPERHEVAVTILGALEAAGIVKGNDDA